MSIQQQPIAFAALCIGLDNAGKTTLLRNLSNSQRKEVFPTANLEIHYINCPKIGKQCIVYDLSGNGRHRVSWRLFYNEVQAVIYVIDTSESEDRFTLQKVLLEEILQDEIIKKKGMPFLFLFNKKDKQITFEKDEILKNMGLDPKKYKNKFYYKDTSGFSGMGLRDAIDVLTDALFAKKI